MGSGGVTGMTGAIAALALLWIGVAALLSLVAARKLRAVSEVTAAANANASLLAHAPARPLVVRANGQIEIDEQLQRELGLERQPRSLADLAGPSGGIVAE